IRNQLIRSRLNDRQTKDGARRCTNDFGIPLAHRSFDGYHRAGAKGLSRTDQRAKISWVLDSGSDYRERWVCSERSLQTEMWRLHKSGNALWVLSDGGAIENVVRKEQGFRVLVELVENALSSALRQLSDEKRVHFEPTANCLLDEANSFDCAEAIIGCPLHEGFAQLLHQRVLSAGDRAQPLPALG